MPSITNNKPVPRLIHNRPGRWAARMPGTGSLRRSSAPARKKAIVGKSRVEPRVAPAPSVCLSAFRYRLTFLGGCPQVSQLSLSLLSKCFHVQSYAHTPIRRFVWLRLRRAVTSVRAFLLLCFAQGGKRPIRLMRRPLVGRETASAAQTRPELR